MTFLKALLERVKEVTVDDIVAAEPTNSPAEGEEIIGSLTHAEQCIYAVLYSVNEKAKNLSVEHQKTHAALDKKFFVTSKDRENQKKLCIEYHKELFRIKEEAKLISAIFLKSVEDRMEKAGKDVPRIGIVKGWQIIAKEPEKFPGSATIGIKVHITRKDGQAS